MLELIVAILSAAPELISDVEQVIADLKSGAQPLAPLTPEVHAALDQLHAKIMLASLAARATG